MALRDPITKRETDFSVFESLCPDYKPELRKPACGGFSQNETIAL
jgi:hypothetical protein